MELTRLAAQAYVGICALVVLFQVALILGAPWGAITQGGRRTGALDGVGRFNAVLSIVLLAGMAGAVASAAGLGGLAWPHWTLWATLGLQFTSCVMNWITPSAPERRLWGPVTTLMLGLVALVWWETA